MIKLNNISKETPYLVFAKKYHQSLKANQGNIEAISISSYSHNKNEVNEKNPLIVKNKAKINIFLFIDIY